MSKLNAKSIITRLQSYSPKKRLSVYLSVALVAGLLLFTVVIGVIPQKNLRSLFSRAQGVSIGTILMGDEEESVRVQVSKDNMTYADKVGIEKGKGYYIKTVPPVNGYLEARSPKPSDPSGYKVFKWDESVGGAKLIGGVGYITPQSLSSFSSGEYKGQFRQWKEEGGNDLPWSNTITLTIASPAAQLKEQRIKVLSFNVLQGYEAFCGGAKQASQLAQTVQFITENKYDIVFLQESECTDRFAQAWQDILTASDKKARISYAKVQYMLSFDKRLAIFSRFPLENPPLNPNQDLSKPLEIKPDIFSYNDDSDHRKILNVIVNINGIKIRLIGIHPSPSGWGQIEKEVKNYVQKFTDLPIIMAGDFNSSTRTIINSNTSWLKNNFNITCLTPDYISNRNCGLTTKKEGVFQTWSENAMGAIDHIAVSKNSGGAKITGPINGQVIRSQQLKYSDHNPISAEFNIITSVSTTKPPVPTPQPSAILPSPQPGVLSVISYNMMAASKPKDITPSFNAIETSMQEGNRWDLVGLQELAEFPQEGISKIKNFKDYFQKKGISYYCETQRLPHWLFKSSICSRYPIIQNSYKEYRIFTYGSEPDKITGERNARILQCALVKAPVGEIIFCNTHTQAQAIGEQKGRIKDIITHTVPRDYIPASAVTKEQQNEWIVRNRARIIFTGDFNSIPTEYIPGILLACDINKDKCDKPYYIDHVTYFNMLEKSIGAGWYTTNPITTVSAFRDTAKSWQTDHLGPVIANLKVSL